MPVVALSSAASGSLASSVREAAARNDGLKSRVLFAIRYSAPKASTIARACANLNAGSRCGHAWIVIASPGSNVCASMPSVRNIDTVSDSISHLATAPRGSPSEIICASMTSDACGLRSLKSTSVPRSSMVFVVSNTPVE